MSNKIEGGCQCGAVRYSSSVAPSITFNCHCTHCQMASGAAFTTAVAVPQGTTEITGSTMVHTLASDLGTPVHRHHCPTCGSYVYGISEGFGATAFNAVTLDDPSWVKPEIEVYVSSAQPWAHLQPDLPKFDQLPPMGEDDSSL
ncbi:MAG: GFA family protein [Alphaproteobacteria bacterium]|nr:GFA family protein [Alphaproteobacteria bacterium]